MWRENLDYTPILFTLLAFIGSITGCNEPIALNSKWCDFEVTTDGMDLEWSHASLFAEKVALTLLNDSNYMYIRLYSRDRALQAQVLGNGLTLWFDPEGGKKKIFGIHFPIGMAQRDMPLISPTGMNDYEMRTERMLEALTDEMEILGPDEKDTARISLAEARMHGIEVGLGCSKGNLVYELKIPLAQEDENSFAVGINRAGVDTTTVIGIGFETPEVKREDMKKRMEEGGMPGPPPGNMQGGKMPGQDQGSPPGAGGQPEHLDLWVKLRLASYL
jgi:hypothetical protein